MKKTVIIFTIILCFGGCTMVETGNKEITNVTKLKTTMKKGSSKSDVMRAFGNPTATDYKDNGKEVWTYSYSDTNVNPLTFVPVIGLLFMLDGTDTETTTLTILFDENEKVEKHSIGTFDIESGLL